MDIFIWHYSHVFDAMFGPLIRWAKTRIKARRGNYLQERAARQKENKTFYNTSIITYHTLYL